MATDQFSLPDNVYHRLRSLNTQIRALASIRGLGIGLTICASVVACCVLLDWIIELPQLIRFSLLGVFCLATIACLARCVVVPLMRRFDSNELAALLEAGNPELNESVSSAIELSDESVPEEYRGSKWMRKQLARRTAKAAADASPANAVSPASSVRGMSMGLLAVALLALPFLVWPSSSRLMAARFFQPWKNLDRPTNLYFDVLNGNRVIAHGSDARIVAVPRWHESEEERPETVVVNWSFTDGDSGSKRMRWDEGDSAYIAEIRHVVADFDYHIAADRARSKNYHITAVVSPQVETLLLDVEPPAYSGLPAEHHDGIIGEVRAFERSTLRFVMTFNKPVKDGSFLWFAESATDNLPPQTHALEIAADGLGASFEMAASESGQFFVKLRDETGLTNGDENRRDLFVIKDREPSVQFTSGREAQSARPDAVVEVGVTSSDDIGVGELSLHYFIEETEAGSIPFPGLNKGARRADHVFEMKLAELDIPEGTKFTYRVRAADERPIPEPNVAWTSERQLIISAAADSLDRQQLTEEQEKLREQIKEIREQVTEDRNDARALKEKARQSERNNKPFDEDKKLAEQASDEFKLSEQLEAVSQELAKHPLFEELAERAQDVSRKDLPKASEELGKAARQGNVKDKQKSITEAEKALNSAEWKLRNLEERFNDLAELEQDLARLDELAKETNELADNVDELETSREQADAEKDAKAQEQKMQEVVDKQNELLDKQQQIAEDLDELADRRPELVDAARKAQMEKLKQIADEARELANRENHLANSFQDEANQNRNESRTTLQKAREAQRQTEQLQRDMEKKGMEQTVDSEPLKEAVAELQKGNLEQPERAMREAADALHEKSQEMSANKGKQPDPGEQNAAGDKTEADDSNSTDQSGDKSAQQPELSAEDRQKLAEAAKRAGDKAHEVADELQQIREEREREDQRRADQQKQPDGQDPNGQQGDEQDAGENQQPQPGELAEQQQQLADAAKKLADIVQADRGPKDQSSKEARQAAQRAQQAADLAQAGFHKQASQSGQQASQKEQKSGDELSKQGDARSQDLAETAKELAEAQKKLSEQMEAASKDPAAARQARQEGQQKAAQQMADLAEQLSEASEQLSSNPVDMPAQGDKAQEAQQSAQQAQQKAQQSSQQAQQSNSKQASQSAREAAKKMQQAANQAQQASNGRVKDTPVPEDVGEQFAKAIKSVQEAGKELGQKPGTQETGDQQGQKPGDSKPGQEGEQGQQGEGQQEGKGQKGEGQQPGQKAGEQGQKGEGKGQQGNGKSGKKPGMGSKQLRDAAKQMAEAAKKGLPRQGENRPGEEGTSRTGENTEAGGNPGDRNGRLEELLGSKQAGRDWGKLPGHLQTEILQGAKDNPNGDYARLIRMYFREIAKATEGDKKAAPPKADK